MADMGSELRPLYRLLLCKYACNAYAVLSEVIVFIAGGSGYTCTVDVMTTWLRSTMHTFQRILRPLPLYLPNYARGLRFDNGRVSRFGV